MSTTRFTESGVDPFSSSNPPIVSTSISRVMLRTSIDGGAESDQFKSLPGTPTTEEDGFFLMDPNPPSALAPALELSIGPSVPLRTEDDRSPMHVPKQPPPEDPSCPVKGMYRLLDLITEQGGNGHVDKIVIGQQSLQAFINAIAPGASSSITKINFKRLDECSLRPLGLYGSKKEIVRFLRKIHAVDDNTARILLPPQNGFTAKGADPILISGLYVVRPSISTAKEQAYILYWPEDTTWGDQADSAVQHNRVMFMRYLTKLCDQIICLLSSKHSQAIVWGDDSGLLYDFVVVKTCDQEENVVARPGFTIESPFFVHHQPPQTTHADDPDLSPRLLYGETMQGFMTAEFKQGEILVKNFVHRNLTAPLVRLFLGGDVVLCLSEKIDDESLDTLMKLGPSDRFPKEFATWERRKGEINQRFQGTLAERQNEIHTILERNLKEFKIKLREAVIIEVLKEFPSVEREAVLPQSSSPKTTKPKVDPSDTTHPLYDLFRFSPKAEQTFRSDIRAANLGKGIKRTEFQFKRERILILNFLLGKINGLDRDQIRSLADAVLTCRDEQAVLGLLKVHRKEDKLQGSINGAHINVAKDTVKGRVKSTLGINNGPKLTREEALWKDANSYASSVSDSDFLVQLSTAPIDEYLHDATADAEETAHACLRELIESLVDGTGQKIFSIQKAEWVKQIEREITREQDEKLGILRSDFVRQVENLSRERSQSARCLHVDSFAANRDNYYSPVSYSMKGRQVSQQSHEIEYHVHALHLQTEQQLNLQVDSPLDPAPTLNGRLSPSFRVFADTIIKYAHLLEGDRILVGLVDSQGNVMIYLDKLSHINAAIKNKLHAKVFHEDKIGQTCLFAFDESKRMLAVYASSRMQLHILVFDVELKSLRGPGTTIDLLPFYDTGVSIVHACFVHGSEEILFVDSSAHARIFSLITLQLKPASLQLSQIPRAIYSSPDGSCMLAVQEEDGVSTLTAYHWSTFASTDGISVTLPDPPVDLNAALLTSINDRNNVHLIGFDLESQSCRSVILEITHKTTEFAFRERRLKAASGRGNHTVPNCLIDCHADVWKRFPVVPAVKRHTVTSSSERQQKTLVFITDSDGRHYSSHLSDLIHTFEGTSQKPTGDELRGISVSARTFPSFAHQYLSSREWPVSRFRAGEWLADLLCLIPIHIATTHDNGFVPVKDGVVSAQLEKSLLGAGVSKIVNSLSLGWYESIFQSYWASKPVKVVSSMGEQSAGNSFTLNHLVDTSFSGSASEGVWMSVSPTDDALIVALNFEGVYSLERSAQEDTLLVLFNTAISNLVLFHDDFALSRDITGLFQSFQSSSSVLDPTSDPSLSQSTLVVIIKGVDDSDKAEVMSELALKFQKLVQDEQDANFITRLHAGELQVIPWPVIESKDFYKPFAALKMNIDQQSSSRCTAGEFSHTLKTLMAKLKANDWGAMSQTMAMHRANSLLAILPNSLETGFSDFPDREHLKNLDTDLEIEAEDTPAQFLLAGPDSPVADRESCLRTLRESWDQITSRQHIDDSEWTSNLAQYLTHLVDLRVGHVDRWLKSNVRRFQAGNTIIEEMRRTFYSAVIDLRAGVELCNSQCGTCNLFCIQSRLHEGGHDCLTSHKCIHDCTFCERDPVAAKPCGQTAGHSGNHLCRVDSHLCGKRCAFSGKQGCMNECVKAKAHKGKHVCSAPVHMCGQPCDLIGLKLPNGKSLTCSGTCRVPINEEHVEHACDRRKCVVSCQLCKRLCSGDHLHGLVPNQSHLCGQEHSCSAECSSPGVCQIDPESMEATFTGRHESFQYTKYTQAAKRLRCVKIIKSGEVEHLGPHVHSNERQPFHFCESRCETCGYFCTLSLGLILVLCVSTSC